MENNNEEAYITVIYNIMQNLKGKIKFKANQIEYCNIELVIEESNIEGVNAGDFSISFQKQNGSFTLIINSVLDEEKKQEIIELIKQSSGIDLFASYNFVDIQDVGVNQFVYDEDKLEFNKDILNQFKELEQISDLKYYKKSNQK